MANHISMCLQSCPSYVASLSGWLIIVCWRTGRLGRRYYLSYAHGIMVQVGTGPKGSDVHQAQLSWYRI